jgi:hypothetical protein
MHISLGAAFFISLGKFSELPYESFSKLKKLTVFADNVIIFDRLRQADK